MLKDPSVSRNHALLIVQESELLVKDLGSTNGTYINGHRLEGQMRLHSGDRLTIGESDLIIGAASEAPVEDPSLATRRMDPNDIPCPNCGSPLDLEQPDCPSCGKSLLDEPAPETSAPTRKSHRLPPMDDELLRFTEVKEEKRERERELEPATSMDVEESLEKEKATPAAADDEGEEPSREVLPSLDELGLLSPPETSSPPESKLPRAATTEVRTPPPMPKSAPAANATPAGLLVRAAALVLDGLLILILGVAVSLLQGGPLTEDGRSLVAVVTAALSILVPVFGWSLWGTTPGKAILGLHVYGLSGRSGIPPLRAVLRLVGVLASVLSLGIGFLMVAFTREKRALHDVIAGTYVARRQGP